MGRWRRQHVHELTRPAHWLILLHVCIFSDVVMADANTEVDTQLQLQASTLQYMSIWELETSPPADAQGWTNFLFTSTNLTVIKEYHQQGIGPSLLNVRDIFFGAHMLAPGYEERWRTVYKRDIEPLMRVGALMGVFLGDELCWNCIPFNNLTTAVNTVRSDIPKGAGIIYYNEAFPVFADVNMWTAACGEHVAVTQGYPHVPSNLDWVSMDYYPDVSRMQPHPYH